MSLQGLMPAIKQKTAKKLLLLCGFSKRIKNREEIINNNYGIACGDVF